MSAGATPIVAEARARLLALCEAVGIPATVQDDGTLAIPHGPTTVVVIVGEADGRAMLDIWAPVLDAPLSPELHRFAAETAFMFGRLCVASTGDGHGQLQLCHAMLADPLDEEILTICLGTVANTAADLATSLPARFGPPAP